MSINAKDRLPSGIPGLDEIIQGGFIQNRSYLIRGLPGSGKTTLGLHFLCSASAKNNEKSLYITLSENENIIRDNAGRLGFDLSRVHFLDLSPTSAHFSGSKDYTIFFPAEVEQEETTQKIVTAVKKLKPKRVFIDAITQLRYLTVDTYHYRRQVLSFLRFLIESGATVLLTSEGSPEAPDEDLQFLSDGVIQLDFSSAGRSISIKKFRGSDFRSGPHAMALTNRGMVVYPKLIPEDFGREFIPETMSSGVPEIDRLLYGGLERGTVTIISGPSGVGKTSLGMQFVKEAASHGEYASVYIFEESVDTLMHRSESIGLSVNDLLKRGTLNITHIEPLKYLPDQLANLVRREVEQKGARIVMLDSIAGYKLSLLGGDLAQHLHALSKYLSNMGVTVLLINEVETIAGGIFKATEAGISYLADNIIFMRYLEYRGQLRRAIGVLKKRLTDFERTLREIAITEKGIQVGAPLTNLRGILQGMPDWPAGEAS
ncbi:MAG: gas vesicle protein GvpD [candidate division KSB1 bacterium]|nr:gas vesicle protein GvpD [candidate division KSB1 bacterium]